jgi:hypothetical protein
MLGEDDTEMGTKNKVLGDAFIHLLQDKVQ